MTDRKCNRGFASMDPARQREIASKGGKASHAKGTAHEWSIDEARAAGRKGGMTSQNRRGARIREQEDAVMKKLHPETSDVGPHFV